MAKQMNVQRLDKIGNRWTQAVVRTYAVDDVLLNPRAISDMNGVHNEIVFELAQHLDDDDFGQVTMVNVYVRDEACFAEAEKILSEMEARINEYVRIIETQHLFAYTIDQIAK